MEGMIPVGSYTDCSLGGAGYSFGGGIWLAMLAQVTVGVLVDAALVVGSDVVVFWLE